MSAWAGPLGALLTLAGVVGVIVCGFMLVARRQAVPANVPTIASVVAALPPGTFSLVRPCGYALNEKRRIFDLFSRTLHHVRFEIRHHAYLGLWLIRDGALEALRSRDEHCSWSAMPNPAALQFGPCETAVRIPLTSIGVIEIGAFGELDHRASSNSHYVFAVVGAQTHVLGRFANQAQAREVRALLERAVREASPQQAQRASPLRDALPQ